MNGDCVSDSLAYFSDGHTEVITEFEVSEDLKEVWFTVESGRWFVYKDEIDYTESGAWRPSYNFYKVVINRDRDEFGAKCDIEYLVTNEIDRITIFMDEGTNLD